MVNTCCIFQPVVTFPYTSQRCDFKTCVHQMLQPAVFPFTYKDTSCTLTSVILSALGNTVSLCRDELRWPSVTRVTGAKWVSKCDKSCWALGFQVLFVHFHLHTKKEFCHKRRCSAVSDVSDLTMTQRLICFSWEKTVPPIDTSYNIKILLGALVILMVAILI